MRRLISNIATKLLTGRSMESYVDERLVNFYERNQIFSTKLTSYRSDQSPTHPNLMIRTYIGTARKNSKPIGLVISYDEGCGYTHGYSVSIEKIDKVRLSYYNYKLEPDHYREFSGYFRGKVCGGKATHLIDSVGNDLGNPDQSLVSPTTEGYEEPEFETQTELQPEPNTKARNPKLNSEISKKISPTDHTYTLNWDAKNEYRKEKYHCSYCNSFSEHSINLRVKEKRCLLCGHESLP